ncbi:DUF6629 family protein [Streptomyces sp. NPDC047000]|uniref:DUF6629 family protein n=1 Tax=Streptomyces sp. NPDC047000 TaxID=3155474 RepID=UPI00340F4A73
MCWSATADLVAGAGISAVGAACVAQVRDLRRLPLAALPLLLGAHQLTEAAVWHAGGGSGPAVVAWAVVALPLLALWVPAAVLCAVPGRARPVLLLPLAAGVVTAAVLACRIATGPVTAEIRGHTVGYVFALPHAALLTAGYLFATAGSLLLSGERPLVVLGVLAAVGAAVCWALWRLEFVSTWCAVAALCSVVLLGRARTVRRSAPRPRSAGGPPRRRSAGGA